MSKTLVKIEYLEGYVIRATLDDETTRELDFEPHLWGPMFEPLKDKEVFRSGVIDPEAQTVVWPNGVDVAPEVWSRGFPENSGEHRVRTG